MGTSSARSGRRTLAPGILLALCLLFAGARAGGATQERRSTTDPNVLAAESYLRQQNYAKAVEALELVLAAEPRSDASLYLLLATAYARAGAPEKALEASARGLAVHPGARRIEELYASLALAAPDRTQAMAELERLLEKRDSILLRKTLAQLRLRENATDPRAGELLASAVRAVPGDAEAHYLYGQWACLNHQMALCVAELNRALALAPSNRQAKMQIYTMIGMAEEQRERPLQAEQAFRAALRLNRGFARPDARAAYQYVKFLLTRTRDEEAQRLLDEILRWEPAFGPALFERAKSLAKRDRSAEALTFAQKALDQTGSEEKEQLRAIHAFLAKTYFALGREAEARTHQSWIEAQR